MSDKPYVRMTFDAMQRRALRHLVSALDEDDIGQPGDGAFASAITGYTEWVGEGEPVLTMGWDWEMRAGSDGVALRRVGDPRSNLCVVMRQGAADDIADSSTLLKILIDRSNWQEETLRYLQRRYDG